MEHATRDSNREGRGGRGAICRALEEADLLLAAGRGMEAATLAGKMLKCAQFESDLVARLLLMRAESFAQCGRPIEMERALRRARGAAQTDLTRARLAECLGVVAWRRLRLNEALVQLGEAETLFHQGALPSGVVRTLGHMAGVRADMGAIREARIIAARRLELACRSNSEGAIAQARGDLAALLLAIGRWKEAARELGDDQTPGVLCLEVRRAGLDLAAGKAQAAVARLAEGLDRTVLPPLLRAEALLVFSDAALAANDPERAELAAGEAIALRIRSGDRGGECRGRVRRAHALLSLGDVARAVREARRAAEIVPEEARGLVAIASATFGRALLRRHSAEAGTAFRRAEEAAVHRRDVAAAAAIGAAVAGGERGWREQVEMKLADLREWGDERLLCLVAQDLRRTAPRGVMLPGSTGVALETALAEAAEALRGPSRPEARWAKALSGFGGVLPWSRAWLVGSRRALEATPHLDEMTDSREDATGVRIARQNPPPCVVSVRGAGSAGRACRHVVAALDKEVVLCLQRDDEDELPDAEALARALDLCHLASRLVPETRGLLGAGEPPPRPTQGAIVGESRSIRTLLAEIGRVAPRTDLAIHISGETGTGKERVARALHEWSGRASKPFVAVNVACLSDELFQSEVFGHVRGAFTHAVADRDGLVSRAEGGTLFLDEVADLSPLAQVKLLRFLQERDYERVGEARVRRADIRIVTASNADLEQRVRKGSFRLDLFYRLDHWVIKIPPLREREGDVRLLTEHFLRGGVTGGRPRGRVAPDAISRLEAYDWPGNVRQLQSVIEKLVVSCGEGLITAEAVDAILPSVAGQTPRSLGLHAAVRGFVRDVVKGALDAHDGHRTRTAASLGISRQALSVRMRQLGL